MMSCKVIERFSIEFRKTKTKLLLWPITVGTKSTMNQPEFKANTCYWRQAREKNVQARHDWFWFYTLLVEKVARILSINHRA